MLRDYQARLFDATRAATLEVESVCIQLPTGGGKTPLLSEIIKSAYTKGRRVWFVVPRNELLVQGSDHLARWKVPHGLISASSQESRAFMVHVVSKDTLLRRIERIKNWPDLILFDEAHIALDAQLGIVEAANTARAMKGLPQMKVLSCTATPERLDGRGLSEVYETCVYGPSIPWLTSAGYLSPLRYFAPPIAGLDTIHRRGTEYDAEELEALLEKRKVYGDVIGYYEKYGTVKKTGYSVQGLPYTSSNQNYHKGKPALIFCRSVKSAHETADRFQNAGYKYFCIEGNMPARERRQLIEAHRRGEIDGLTNCEIATYGLDIPRIEYGASIRPTLSRSLYFQMVGRILRPFPGKDEALFFDHANLVQDHQLDDYPGVPLFYIDNIEWNFNGREKRARKKNDDIVMRQCPNLDYLYCAKPSCVGCQYLKQGETDPRRQALEVVDAKLEERKGPTHFSDLLPEEKRNIQDRIGRAADAALEAMNEGTIEPGAIGELLTVAAELGRSVMWVYWLLSEKQKRRTVNVPLLHEIARQKGYSTGWCWFKTNEIRKGIHEKEKEAVV